MRFKNKNGLFLSLVLGAFALFLFSFKCDSVRDQAQKTYTEQIGTLEATGQNDGQMVETYLATTNQKAGAPWCAAFVNYVLLEAKCQVANSAWSPSWFPEWRTIYKRGEYTKDIPRRGDVFGIYFSNLGRIAHVGFIDQWGTDYVITVEGNTNDNLSRDGDGVYKKRRATKTIYKVADWITPCYAS